MKNYVQKGESIDVTLVAAALSGSVIALTNMVVVAAKDGEIGDVVACSTVGVYTLPKNATEAFTQGQDVYWDSDPGELTATSTDNTYAGKVWAAAATADTEAQIKINV